VRDSVAEKDHTNMAQRRRPKRSWVKGLLFYVFVPLSVWLVAFVIWFYWYDLRDFFTQTKERTARPKMTRQLDKDDKANRLPGKRPQEKIFDDERKKLDDIIKRQQ
jgi:hypothetical protein